MRLSPAGLVLRCAPFPLPIRLALPFTFFLCYQYAVVARSYCLAPLLLFLAAILYRRGSAGAAGLTVVLALLAAVSVHGMALSLSIWLAFHVDIAREWRKLPPACRRYHRARGRSLLPCLILLSLAAWPAADNIFVRHPYWSLEHVVTVAGKALRGGFAGGWILSLGTIALSLPLLWRGRTLLLFLATLVSLSLVNGIVYSQVWHYGLIFLGWLFAVWIAAYRAKPGWSAIAALAIVIGIQCYWTAESIAYDWGQTYSASRDAAAYLRQTGIARAAYLRDRLCLHRHRALLSREHLRQYERRPQSLLLGLVVAQSRERGQRETRDLRPDYVIVGYKGSYEKDLWTRQIHESGYLLLRHFEGNTFWQSAILEPESFDLYRRPAAMTFPETIRFLIDQTTRFISPEAVAAEWAMAMWRRCSLRSLPSSGDGGFDPCLRAFVISRAESASRYSSAPPCPSRSGSRCSASPRFPIPASTTNSATCCSPTHSHTAGSPIRLIRCGVTLNPSTSFSGLPTTPCIRPARALSLR